MKGTGRHSEHSGLLVILLLVVGLTAFSHSMKELTEIHQLTLDASRLVAQWSGNFTPAEVPQTVVKIEKVESCAPVIADAGLATEGHSYNDPSETVPAGPGRPRQPKIDRIQPRIIQIPREAEIAKLKKLRRGDIDSDAFEVRIPDVQIPEALEPGSKPDMPELTFRAKARKAGAVKLSPRDREMILKTLNRSINLRIAS